MPLDPNISLNVQQYDPVGAYGKAAQLGALFGQQKLQGMQIAQAEREQKNAQTMADLYKGNVNPDGTINRAGMIRGAADAGQGASIPGMTKQWGEADEALAKVQKLKGEIGEQNFKMLTDSTKAVGSRLASILARHQSPTEAEVMGEIGSMVRDGYFNVAAKIQGTTPDALALSRMQDMPRGNPQALRGWLVSLGAQNMEAAKLFEAVTPQLQQVNNGKVTSFVDKNPVTNPGGPAPIQMTTTPGEDLSASTSRNNAAASRAQADRHFNVSRGDSMTQPVYMQTEAGLVALPKKIGAGQSPVGVAVVGPDGMPIKGKSNMTEDQAKATGWLNQANNAWKNMQSAMGGTDSKTGAFRNAGVARPGFADAVANIPSMGLGEAIGNSMRSPDRQKFVQASSSLSEALLRAATGAGVNQQESEQKIRELTPVFGEAPETTQQKMAAIPMYLESLQVRAGPGARNAPMQSSPSAQPAANAVPPYIQAIIKKHRGK